MLILKQIKNAKIEGISCDFSDNASCCSDDSVYLDADLYGSVNANVGEGSCSVNYDGGSGCGGL